MENLKQILVIDDDEVFLTIVSRFLQPKYEVIVTSSCNGALKKIAGGLMPDLILLDIIMPEINGWETYKILKGVSLLNDVPIVFVTSLNSIIDKLCAHEIGAAGYITKPVDRESLLKRIEGIFKDQNYLRRFSNENQV